MSKDTILIVDDNASIRKLLEVALPPLGLEVLSVSNAKEAIELFRQHPRRIALVLIDGDGPETLTALRAIDPGVRCCFMSALPARYTPGELSSFGVADFFPKPFKSLQGLAQRLREIISSAPG
jgi:DNA-binding NtrC family response regulator